MNNQSLFILKLNKKFFQIADKIVIIVKVKVYNKLFKSKFKFEIHIEAVLGNFHPKRQKN